MTARNIPLTIARFRNALSFTKQATGDQKATTWGAFVEAFAHRRRGAKDGPCFTPARFTLEPDGRRVRRLKSNLAARTAIALDIETNKATGEIPPAPIEVLSRARDFGLACLVYTSHNHHPMTNIRYRIVFPLSDEIALDIPAPEMMAADLGLSGVLDASKIGAASVFYMPSCDTDAPDHHFSQAVDGEPIDADCITETGIGILGARKMEEDRIASGAQAAAAQRREEKLAAGFDPDDSLIEKIRVHLDLQTILAAHRYDQYGSKFRHPNSSSGIYGANVKTLGGIDRIFSHNATDPLHADNLPEWCGNVTALDAFDVAAILDYCGDRKQALIGLAEKYGLSKTAEKKELARMLFRMIRRKASKEEIKSAALAEGQRLGLSFNEACQVTVWVREKILEDRGAA